jgi:hypothetical protein
MYTRINPFSFSLFWLESLSFSVRS